MSVLSVGIDMTMTKQHLDNIFLVFLDGQHQGCVAVFVLGIHGDCILLEQHAHCVFLTVIGRHDQSRVAVLKQHGKGTRLSANEFECSSQPPITLKVKHNLGLVIKAPLRIA